jgi:cysteine-rich repeat protein
MLLARLVLLLSLLAPVAVSALDGELKTPIGIRKISSTAGGLTGPLFNADRFGGSVAGLGDLDGDGNLEVAVGAYTDNDGGATNSGAVYILSLDSAGGVVAEHKISDAAGGGLGGPGTLDAWELFGLAVASLGDVDGDGVGDLAVGTCPAATIGVCDAGRGHAWVLLLDPLDADYVKSAKKIGGGSADFLTTGVPGDVFGWSVAGVGDLDGDHVPDLAAGAPQDDRFGTDLGSLRLVLLNPDGTAKHHGRHIEIPGDVSVAASLEAGSRFGWSVAPLGDLDGDGLLELAVGAPLADGGGSERGSVWIVSLRRPGSVEALMLGVVKSLVEIGDGDFTGTLADFDHFGSAVAPLGDLNGDGVPDLAVGAGLDDTGGSNQGAVWILFLNANGTVKSSPAPVKIAEALANFPVTGLDPEDLFGAAAAPLGDVDGDGVMDLMVGALGDDDGGPLRGAVFSLFLQGQASVCGDGVLDPVFEVCDDGGTADGDGCDAACALEPCGNGRPDVGEECDDGDLQDYDGCSSTCENEEAIHLDGTAAGGSVDVTIDAVALSVSTSPGDSYQDVVGDVAAAINASGALQALGTSAFAGAGAVIVNGSVDALTLADAGLVVPSARVMDITSSSLQLLTAGAAPASIAQAPGVVPPSFSPDGSVSFVAGLFGPESGVIQTPGTTGSPTIATYASAANQALTWSEPVARGSGALTGLFGLTGWGTLLPLDVVGTVAITGVSGGPLLWGASLPGTTAGGGWTTNRLHGVLEGLTIDTVNSTFILTAVFQTPQSLEGSDTRRLDGVGALNMVTPAVVYPGSALGLYPESGPFISYYQPIFARLSVQFVPEPTAALGLLTGAVLLGLLGRSRRRG